MPDMAGPPRPTIPVGFEAPATRNNFAKAQRTQTKTRENQRSRHNRLAAASTPARPAAAGKGEQIVRFARRNILFYDEFVFDCTFGSARFIEWNDDRETRETSTIQAAVFDHKKRRTRPVLFSRNPDQLFEIAWWAHQGSNLGPAD
jgi:hypothetical protein